MPELVAGKPAASDLPAFGTHKHCPKCGHAENTLRYCRAGDITGLAYGEHMLRTCMLCSYTWAERTLDQSPPDPRGKPPRFTMEGTP